MSLCTLCGKNPIDPQGAPFNCCTACFANMTMQMPSGAQQAAAAQAAMNQVHATMQAQAAQVYPGSFAGQHAGRAYRGTPRGRMFADMICTRCGCELEPGAPDWVRLCKKCYREDREHESNAVLKRALEAENKVELAKKVVIELQGKLRQAEGRLRAINGQVGLQKGAPVAGAMGLDRSTLERMRRLCHPDKHGGNQAAHEVTQLLNGLIDQAK